MISVHDVEILKNVFCCTFKDVRTLEVRSFVVSPWHNDWVPFCEHYLAHEGLIGFNSIGFDENLLHPFLLEFLIDKQMGKTGEVDAMRLIEAMCRRTTQIIRDDFKEEYHKPLVPQRDLYRIYHFNNKARMTSLKYLQINMGWPNVQAMPFKHTDKLTKEQISTLLEYNINDVESTYAFYLRSRDKIRLRNKLSDKYGIDMGNFNDGKIGEAIFLKEIAKRTGRSERDLRNCRTPRKSISINECIVPGVEFKSKPFQAILDKYRKMVISSTRKAESMFCVFDGVKYEFGLGGLHACRGAGVYLNVKSADVKSYYPNLSIKYRLYPQHLGPVFCDVYHSIFLERDQYAKGTEENLALKYALNIPYGQSNAPWSPFYDPKYTMAITVNGQLLLAMLCEEITLRGAGRVLMANTDGIEVDVINQTLFEVICTEWMTKTKLTLETTAYNKLCIRDVNNYIGFTVKGDTKSKGAFELEKEEIHKAQGMPIVRKAVYEFFKNNTPIEQTIKNSIDISDFIIGKRARTGNLEYRYAGGGDLIREELPTHIRYYVSRSGGSIVKVLSDNAPQVKVVENQLDMFGVSQAEKVDKFRIVDIHSGYRVTMFNKWVEKPFSEYNLELNFYVREANKLIDSVVKNQTSI